MYIKMKHYDDPYIFDPGIYRIHQEKKIVKGAY